MMKKIPYAERMSVITIASKTHGGSRLTRTYRTAKAPRTMIQIVTAVGCPPGRKRRTRQERATRGVDVRRLRRMQTRATATVTPNRMSFTPRRVVDRRRRAVRQATTTHRSTSSYGETTGRNRA
jgi:hypothetical protein